jgi:hypothetical protein
VLLVVLAGLPGCGPGELTRGEAKRLLNKSDSLESPYWVLLDKDTLRKRVDSTKPEFQPKYEDDGENPQMVASFLGSPLAEQLSAFLSINLVPTPEEIAGDPELKDFKGVAILVSSPGSFCARPNDERFLVHEVTGISRGAEEPLRIVEFSCRPDLSEDILSLVDELPTCSGTATFRLYDDGWRVADVEWSYKLSVDKKPTTVGATEKKSLWGAPTAHCFPNEPLLNVVRAELERKRRESK